MIHISCNSLFFLNDKIRELRKEIEPGCINLPPLQNPLYCEVNSAERALSRSEKASSLISMAPEWVLPGSI